MGAVVSQMGGSFLKGGGEHPMGGIGFDGRIFEKNRRMGEGTPPPPTPPIPLASSLPPSTMKPCGGNKFQIHANDILK